MKTELDNDSIPKHLGIKPGTPVISVYQATLIDAEYYYNNIPEHLSIKPCKCKCKN